MAKKRAFKLISTLLPATQIALLGSLVLIFLLAMLGFTIILNRRLVVQVQATLSSAEYKSVSNIANLNREHLRLYALIQRGAPGFDKEAFTLQRNLVASRLSILKNAYNGIIAREKGQQQVSVYSKRWASLQSELTAWAANPQDESIRAKLLAEFPKQELLIYKMMDDSQTEFETHAEEWISSASFLANLLTGASVIFMALAALTTYSIFQILVERRRAEEALRISERRHRAILDMIPDQVYRITRAGIFTDFKPAKDFGSPGFNEQFIGQKIGDFLPPDIAETGIRLTELALQTGQEQVFEYQLPAVTTKELLNFEARIIASGVDEVQIIVRDITEEKQYQQKLEQAQKLESLGVLVGGIAHDFNNLLTGMLAQTSLAKLKLSKGLTAELHIDKAILSAKRAADLTRQLLAYAGKGQFQIVRLDLNQLLRENAGLLETAMPNRAELQLELAEALPPIGADRGQIQQVVMNLVINAAEALHDAGGYVNIKTRRRTISTYSELAHYIGDNLHFGHYISLEVSDNGVGMNKKTLNRIFDPFFSTKQQGHGLGLSATLGVIRTHHGGIHVQSQEGIGTTFTVLFPIGDANLTEELETEFPIRHKQPNRQIVLVIDDEPLIREAVVDILEASGLNAIAVAGGEAGVKLFRQHMDRIGVVLLDMKMPGMSGEETYRILRQVDPNIKVILSSGYNESEVSQHFNEHGVMAFLQKPYNYDLLTQQVYKILLN